MLEAYGGTRGVCVNQAVGHVGLDARCQGFADAMAEAGLESEVLAISNDPAEAATTMDDFFTMCIGQSICQFHSYLYHSQWRQ